MASSFARRLNPPLPASTAVDHPDGTIPGFIGASAASHKPRPGDFSLSSYQKRYYRFEPGHRGSSPEGMSR